MKSRPRYEYGVYRADFLGPGGEIVLLAFTANGRLAFAPYVIPLGHSSHDAADALTAQLAVIEPDRRAILKVI